MIKCCRAGRACSRAFSSLNIFAPGMTIRKINRKLYIKLGYIISTNAQSERDLSQAGFIRTALRAQMSAKKLSDVEFLTSVVKNGILNSHDSYT